MAKEKVAAATLSAKMEVWYKRPLYEKDSEGFPIMRFLLWMVVAYCGPTMFFTMGVPIQIGILAIFLTALFWMSWSLLFAYRRWPANAPLIILAELMMYVFIGVIASVDRWQLINGSHAGATIAVIYSLGTLAFCFLFFLMRNFFNDDDHHQAA